MSGNPKGGGVSGDKPTALESLSDLEVYEWHWDYQALAGHYRKQAEIMNNEIIRRKQLKEEEKEEGK